MSLSSEKYSFLFSYTRYKNNKKKKKFLGKDEDRLALLSRFVYLLSSSQRNEPFQLLFGLHCQLRQLQKGYSFSALFWWVFL